MLKLSGRPSAIYEHLFLREEEIREILWLHLILREIKEINYFFLKYVGWLKRGFKWMSTPRKPSLPYFCIAPLFIRCYFLKIKMLLAATLVASLAASVSAHATFQELWVNGVDQGNFCVRLPASNSPVTVCIIVFLNFNILELELTSVD